MKIFTTLPKAGLFFALIFLFTTVSHAQTTNITGPAGSGSFGYTVHVLTNGNYVVTDPYWDNGATADVGAVYLYNGATHALISTVTGSTASDYAGMDGITPLANGNFVIRTLNWDNGAATNAGAVTWVNGVTGLNAPISSANSLVGSTINDNIGSGGITALINGNYVVRSHQWNNGAATDAGAVTWGSGTTGVSGVVSAANSLVGSSIADNASSSVIQLTNGNYVVKASNWDNGAAADAGAVTWASGTAGISGVISAANSLVGSTVYDQVGSNALITLTNGNYVVGSTLWDNGPAANAGAATWCSGTTGRTGPVTTVNSLVGNHAGAEVGNQLTALTNGNYVVQSPFWDNTGAGVSNAGAVTWGNGATGTTGIVSTANSLVGGRTDDLVGAACTALTNGNYVTGSASWDNGATVNVGAATWCSGTGPITGTVSSANSLVGSTVNDQVGVAIALTNGNYITRTILWDNGGIVEAGAVTWCNGTTGRVGTISSANSVVGSTALDYMGNTAIALTNGNYVVASSNWDNGAIADAGAARLCNGTTGATGVVTSSNSLIGTNTNDRISGTGTIILSNGNFVIRSTGWDNGAIVDAGAVTWCSGTTATTGTITTANSLVGSTLNDRVGFSGVYALANGNYVTGTSTWDKGAVTDAGAVTWGNGTTGTTGTVSIANSLVGSTISDQVGAGTGIIVTPDGNYMFRSANWDTDILSNAGAVSFGDGTTGVTGVITTCNSVLGNIAGAGGTLAYVYDTVYDQMIVGKANENIVSIFDTTGTNSLASGSVCRTENVVATGSDYKNACKHIARVIPSGANPVSGSINACVTIDATQKFYNAEPYVQRHYDIEPATANTTTTSATITLYFTDGEFSTFNTNNPAWPPMPTVAGGGNSDPNRANLKITQYHGTSTISPSEPGMYTVAGAGVYINPNDNNIVWNGKYWAVTFDVVGFSGFYAHSNPVAPLPVSVNYFRGAKQGSNHLLDWKVTCNTTSRVDMILERSATAAGPFAGINTIAADALRCNQPFNYTDAQPLKGMNYYRLKITDDNGKISYSNIVALLNADKGFEIAGIVPNPVLINGKFKLNISSTYSSILQLSITDIQGRPVMHEQQTIIAGFTSIDMNVNHLAPGTYYISAITDDGKKKVVRFVKQ